MFGIKVLDLKKVTAGRSVRPFKRKPWHICPVLTELDADWG